jgi:dTDP-4-amino-4,6-dideoxygalactose transaminase
LKLRELPPTAGLAPRIADLFERPAASLEDALCGWLDVDSVQLASSGTASLYIVFEHLKTLSAARVVIVPAYTCPLVALAAAKAGLSVHACDVQKKRFDYDADALLALLDSHVLCVVATHWGGALSDTVPIRRALAARAPGAFLVEDCAQAFGGTVHGRPVGFSGDAGVFSFAVGKGLTLFEGGCIVSRDDRMRAGLKAAGACLLKPDRITEVRRQLELVAYHLAYRPAALRVAYGRPRRYWMRRNNLARALGDEQSSIPVHPLGRWRKRVAANAIRRLPAHLEASRAILRRLSSRLAGIEGIDVHSSPLGAVPPATFAFVSFTCAEVAMGLLRDAAALGTGISKLYAHVLDGYRHIPDGVVHGTHPNATDLAARTLTMTTSPYMTPEDEDDVIGLIRTAAAGARLSC